MYRLLIAEFVPLFTLNDPRIVHQSRKSNEQNSGIQLSKSPYPATLKIVHSSEKRSQQTMSHSKSIPDALS